MPTPNKVCCFRTSTPADWASDPVSAISMERHATTLQAAQRQAASLQVASNALPPHCVDSHNNLHWVQCGASSKHRRKVGIFTSSLPQIPDLQMVCLPQALFNALLMQRTTTHTIPYLRSKEPTMRRRRRRCTSHCLWRQTCLICMHLTDVCGAAPHLSTARF